MRIKLLMTSTLYSISLFVMEQQPNSILLPLHALKAREYQHSTDSNGTLIDGSC